MMEALITEWYAHEKRANVISMCLKHAKHYVLTGIWPENFTVIFPMLMNVAAENKMLTFMHHIQFVCIMKNIDINVIKFWSIFY